MGGLVHRSDDVRDLALDLGHLRGCLRLVPGDLAQLDELRVLLRQVGRGRIAHHRDPQRAELRIQARRFVGQHHQVGFVRRDGLHVRVALVEVRAGGVRRVVGVLVDRLDLAARADGVEHLGRGRRQRHDRRGTGRDPHGAVGRVHGHGERRRADADADVSGEGQDRHGGTQRGCREALAPGPGEHFDHPPSVCGGRSAPDPTPDGYRTNRPSSEDWLRRPKSGGWARPRAGASPLRDSAGFRPDFAELEPPRHSAGAGRTVAHRPEGRRGLRRTAGQGGRRPAADPRVSAPLRWARAGGVTRA